jgi:hypothetical protein
MNHFLTRQLGLLQVELEELYEADVFSDLADLDYLSKLKTRLANLIKELAADGQVDKDPLGVLKNDWKRAKQWTTGLNDIVDKLDSSLNELKERKEWTEEELKEELSALGSSHEEFEKELDILNRKYFKKKADWTGKDTRKKVCPETKYDLFIKVGTNIDVDFGFNLLLHHVEEGGFDGHRMVRDSRVFEFDISNETLNLISEYDLNNRTSPSVQFFKICSEITRDEAIKNSKLGALAVVEFWKNNIYDCQNTGFKKPTPSTAKSLFEIVSSGDFNLLCPIIESFDSFEEEEGQGFCKLLNDAHQTYLSSAQKFKSVYENKTKDVEKYLESKQKTLADAQSLVEEGEEAWKKDELEKVKVCLSKISSFPQFAIELRKSYETYDTALFVVSKYCETISKIQKLLLDYESDSKYNSSRRNFELSEKINNSIDSMLRRSKFQDFYKYKDRFLVLSNHQTMEAVDIIRWAFTYGIGEHGALKHSLEFYGLDFYDLPIEKWKEEHKMAHLMIYGDDHQLPNKYKLTRKWAEMEKLGKEILSHVSKIDKCFHYSTPEILDRISSSKKDLVKSVKLLPELCTKELITEVNCSGSLHIWNRHIDLHSLQKILAGAGKKPFTQRELDAEEKQKREKEKEESEKEKETPYAGCGCLILLAVIIYIIIESCSS